MLLLYFNPFVILPVSCHSLNFSKEKINIFN